MPPRPRNPRNRRQTGGAAAGTTPALLNKVPAAWKSIVQDGWEITSTDDQPLVLMTEEEFLEKHKSKTVVDTFLNNAEAMERHLETSGLEDNVMGRYYALFPNIQMETLVQYTNQQLALESKEPTNQTELRKHISLTWARSLYKHSTDLIWANEFAEASSKHNFVLPTHQRFIDLTKAIRGYPVQGRRGDFERCR